MKWDVRRWMPWVTLVTDVLLINVAFMIAYWLRYNLQLFRSVDPANNVPYAVYLPLVALLTIVLVLSNRREGAYDVRRGHPLFDDIYGVIERDHHGHHAARGTGLLLPAALLLSHHLCLRRPADPPAAGPGPRDPLVRAGPAAPGRPGGRSRADHRRGRGGPHRHAQPDRPARPGLPRRSASWTTTRSKAKAISARSKRSAASTTCPRRSSENAIDQVIITLPWQYHRKIVRLVTEAEQAGVRARVVPDLFQLSLGGVDVEAINGIPLISIKESALIGFNQAVKRAVDLTLGGLAMILLSPFWLRSRWRSSWIRRARSSSGRNASARMARRSRCSSSAPCIRTPRSGWKSCAPTTRPTGRCSR